MSPKLIVALTLVSASARAGGSASAKASQARVDAAAAAFDRASRSWQAGTTTLDAVCTWSERWYLAQRDQPLEHKALVVAADADLQRMQDLETLVQARIAAGASSTDDAATVTYFRAEAELFSAQAHRK